MKPKPARQILSLYHHLSYIDRLHVYIRLRRPVFEIAEKYIPAKGKILDFGCGHGLFSHYLSLTSKQRSITAVDISRRKIKLAQQSRPNQSIKFIHQKDPGQLLKSGAGFDSIVILSVLYLLPQSQQKAIIKKTSQALKPGGRLILTEPDSSFYLQTQLSYFREWLMTRVFRLTAGQTLIFNSSRWWQNLLKEYYQSVKIVKLDKLGFQKLYLAIK